jgi:hypothetical protein
LTCSGIDALPSFPSFPGAAAIPSSLGFVGEGVIIIIIIIITTTTAIIQ